MNAGRIWLALAIFSAAACAAHRVSADTIDANSFTFTNALQQESPANDFHLTIKGNFVGTPSSDVFPNRSNPTNVQVPMPMGTVDFSGNSVALGSSANVKFQSTGNKPSPTGYFTKDHTSVGDNPIMSKALDGTVVSFVPRLGGFDVTLSVFNEYGAPLSGSMEVLVNSGFSTNFNLDGFDTPNNARLLFAQTDFTLAQGQGFTNVAGFLNSSDE